MSSIFEEITRVVVQEMDTGGDMIAIRSILHVDRFHCCSLVRGRRNFWGHQYHRTDLILEDTLERGEGEELFEKLDSGPQGQCEGLRDGQLGDFVHSCSTTLSTPHCQQPWQPVNKEFICPRTCKHVHTPQFEKCTKDVNWSLNKNFSKKYTTNK